MCVSVSLYSVCSHVFCELFRPWTEQIPVDSVFRLLVYNVQVYFREVLVRLEFLSVMAIISLKLDRKRHIMLLQININVEH